MLPVVFLTILISAPKFLEADLEMSEEGYYYLTVTELRQNPNYVIYYMAARVMLTGVIPIILLTFFYFKVNLKH